MTITNLDNLIAEAAQAHRLPATLISAIIQIESGGNPWAVRFEPAFFARYIEKKRWTVFGAVSQETEKMMLATSFGPMQILGVTARELGFAETFLSQLCDPALGIEYGCLYLAKQRDRFFAEHGWEGVIASYNAGSPRRNAKGIYNNQVYCDKVIQQCGPLDRA